MGSGVWDVDDYSTRNARRQAAGMPAFAYSATVQQTGNWQVHHSLDPKALNSLGQKVRECRDTDEHPESTAIAVIFDVTGSMGIIPEQLQKKLPKLLGLLIDKKYVPHPQILFGAIGDANSDRIPLQLGQFESDNRMDEQLESIILEGRGGGQVHETYELALYFLSRHSELDCLDKRGQKGYLFTIGDEMFYDTIYRNQVMDVIGDDIGENISTAAIVRELKRKYHYFHIIATGGSHGSDPDVEKSWRSVLGENVLKLDDPDAVCETIAVQIGMVQGTINLPQGLNDLKQLKVGSKTIQSVSNALAPIDKGRGLAKGTGGSLPGLDNPSGSTGGSRRL